MKLVCSWCNRVIAGPIVGIEGADEVAPLICKACFYEVFEEGDKTDLPEIYAAIQTGSRRYENQVKFPPPILNLTANAR